MKSSKIKNVIIDPKTHKTYYKIDVDKERGTVIVLEDIFDEKKLDFIIDNFESFYDKLGRFRNETNTEYITDKRTILSLLQKLKIKTKEYFPSKSNPKGRLFAKNSLQGISRVVRHTLCKELCIDIDIVNAHNVFLLYYCEKHNIKCEWLKYYVENRDLVLKGFMKDLNCDRDKAKQIVLVRINSAENYTNLNKVDKWYRNFNTEIENIQKQISLLNPELFKKSQKENPDNPYGTCLNVILCEIENNVLLHMYDWCLLNNIRVSTVCFDGLLIEKCDFKIKELNDYVISKVGFEVKIIEKEMNEGIPLSLNTNFITHNDKYVNPNIFNTNDRIILVKSPLGSGKTTSTIEHIDDHKKEYNKIYVLTPRITYAKSIHSRLKDECSIKDWVLYNSMKKKEDYKLLNDYIIIQCESLHRLVFNDNDSILLILDESESFLTSLTSTKTHKKHEESIDIFLKLLNQCKKIICLDAFLSEKTTNVLKDNKLNYIFHNYTRKMEERYYVEIKERLFYNPFDDWSNYMLNEIILGKKLYLFFTSKNKLLQFASKIPLNEEEYIIYTADCKNSVDNVNELWMTKKVILTTCTMTVGVNFDKEHFDFIGIWCSSASKNRVRDIFQSSYRIRHFKEKKMVFYIDKRHWGINLSLDREEVKTMFQNQITLKEDLYYKCFGKDYKNKDVLWFENLLIDNTLELNFSIMKTRDVFFSYLKECNYNIEMPNEEIKDIEEEIQDDLEDEEIDNSIEYEDIPYITLQEFRELRLKPIKSNMDLLKIQKYFFSKSCENIDDIEDEKCLWCLYTEHGRKKFFNLQYEKGLMTKTLDLKFVIQETLPILASNLGIQLELIQKINTWLNIKHTQDIGTIIPNDKLQKLIPIFKENITEIYTAFDLRESRGKKVPEFTIQKMISITNQVLQKWGFTTIIKNQQVRKTINGKRVDVSDYLLTKTNGLPCLMDVNAIDFIKPKITAKRDFRRKEYNPIVEIEERNEEDDF